MFCDNAEACASNSGVEDSCVVLKLKLERHINNDFSVYSCYNYLQMKHYCTCLKSKATSIAISKIVNVIK